MPLPNLRVPYAGFLEQNARHEKLVNALPSLQPALQKMIAELVLVRLFDDLQDAIAGLAYRIACATPYIDATQPVLFTPPARSTAGARELFETYGRQKRQYVKWSKVKYIRSTVKNVISISDPFVLACDRHALAISEMQTIRNRIAHRNIDSRKQFDIVLRRYYGGAPKSVTPGQLLLSARGQVAPLRRYLVETRVIVRECARA